MKIGVSREVDIAYCAGLLEGEGSFSIHKNGLVLQCSMSDKEPLETLLVCFGGHLGGPYVRGEAHHKPMWKWMLGRRSHVIKVCEEVYPFMGPRRRQQIDKLLEYNKIKPKTTRDFPEHGTLSMYCDYKCRCEPCRKVNADYMKEWRKKRKCA